MSPTLYEIKLVCNTCKKTVAGQKEGYRDVAVPPWWGLLSGTIERSPSTSTAIAPELCCSDCLPKRAADVMKTASADARVGLVVERFIR